MENGVRILHREENVAPVRSAESKQRPQAEALTSQRICFIPTILHSCISVTCAAILGFLWTFFFAVRIQHSLICQTVLSYSSANPSQVPYECFKGSKPHCQLLNSARCLQSEAVSKGCVEFVEAAEQRKRDRSCLHCTSAAVMFPPWTQQEELEHMGADSVSQPAGSLHKTAQICCFLLQEFPFLFLKLSLKWRNHQTNFS